MRRWLLFIFVLLAAAAPQTQAYAPPPAHPLQTVRGLWTAVTHPGQTLDAITIAMAEYADRALGGDPRAIGAGVFGFVGMALPASKVKYVDKVVDVSSGVKSPTQLEFGFVKYLENPSFVIYKASHLEANPGLLRPGEYKLNLPNLGNAELNWAQNQQALQRAMNIGNPIRDLSPNYGGGFLQREREFLIQAGWKYDPTTAYWNPPTR